MKRMTSAAWLLTMAVVFGAPAAMADEVRGEAARAGEEVTGRTPLTVFEDLNCESNCVDIWELKCTQTSNMIEIVMHDEFCVEDTFQGILQGLTPTAANFYLKGNAASNSGCNDGFIGLIKPGSAAVLKASFTVTALPGSSPFRDYSLELYCHNWALGLRNGSIVLKHDG